MARIALRTASLVAAEIIHDHEVAGLESWNKELLDICEEATFVDRTVDDDLRQVEGKKIERQRGQDHEQNPNLILARVLPDVPEEPGFHALTRVSCSAGGEQFTAATGSGINC